jgi:predicted nucleic acid-binding protein
MKAVVDTSAIIWLNKIDRLDLLQEIYDKLIAPPAVFDELRYPVEVLKFANRHIAKLDLSEIERKYENLVRKYMSRFRWSDRADIEVFVTYKFFTKTDEMLFANKGAKESLSKYGHVRELFELYQLAEKYGLFTRRDTIRFIDDLIKVNYRVPDLKILKKQLL